MGSVYIGSTKIDSFEDEITISKTAKLLTEITSVTIPSDITIIGSDAFESLTKVTSITIPASVKEIESSAFSDSGLTSITIPASVTDIGMWAFRDCTALKKVYFAGNPPSMFGDCAFEGVSGATFYYKSGNTKWTAAIRTSTYGGSTGTTWATY